MCRRRHHSVGGHEKQRGAWLAGGVDTTMSGSVGGRVKDLGFGSVHRLDLVSA